jgi:hypothetical protein
MGGGKKNMRIVVTEETTEGRGRIGQNIIRPLLLLLKGQSSRKR